MTAPAPEARPAHPRPTRPARRSGAATALTVVAALVGATLGSLTGAVVGAGPAVAGWRAEATSASGPLSMASFSAGLETRSGTSTTAVSNPYSASGLLALGSGLVDVVNTSSAPARLTVVLNTSGVSGLAVQSCSVPWTSALACAPGAQDITSGSSSARTWTVDLDSQARQYVKVSMGLSVGATITLGATAQPQRTGQDRTAS